MKTMLIYAFVASIYDFSAGNFFSPKNYLVHIYVLSFMQNQRETNQKLVLSTSRKMYSWSIHTFCMANNCEYIDI